MPALRPLLICSLLLFAPALAAGQAGRTAQSEPREATEADAPRDAEAILEAYRDLEPPLPEPERMEDPDYMAEYDRRFQAVVREQTALIRELAEVAPEHDALDTLLELLWARTGIGDLSFEGYDPIAHMQAYLEAHPKKPAAKQARLYLPLSRLYRLTEVESDAAREVRATAFAEMDEYLEAYPEEEIAAKLKLVWMKVRFVGPDETAERVKIYRQIAEVAPDTKQARRALGQLRQIEEIGEPFELRERDLLSGERIDVQDYKGEIVAVIFWATYSGPCRTALPIWQELLDKYEDRGVVFLGVPVDLEKERVLEFCEAQEIDWPQLWMGPKAEDFTEGWGIYNAPTIFLVDHEGNLADTQGALDLEGKLQNLLAQRDDRAQE